MPDYLTFTDATSLADLQTLAGESMGWQPLGEGAYLHHGGNGDPQVEQVLHVVGVPDIALIGLNMLLLT